MSKKTYSICEIPGDGIGSEIVGAAKKVLESTQNVYGFKLKYELAPCGDEVKKRTGTAIPEESIETFRRCDATLKGPVGETVRDFVVAFRQAHDLYINVRPAYSYPLICPPALRPDIKMVIVRENSEGFYKSIENEVIPGVWTATGVYTKRACDRIARFSFEYAMKRLKKGIGKGRVTCAHKANILRKTHGMFLEAFKNISAEYPDIKFDDYYADAMCIRLVREPQDFDVVVSTNLLADLLSDLAGQVAGGIGLTAGTNINPEEKRGLFEPTHGCAPDIAGTGKANPIGQIRSAAMMLDFLGTIYNDDRCTRASVAIENSIEHLLSKEKRVNLPIELGGNMRTDEVADLLAFYIKRNTP